MVEETPADIIGQALETTQVYSYPTFFILGLLVLGVAAAVIKWGLGSCSPSFRPVSKEGKRNIVSYLMNIVVSTISFVLSVGWGVELLFRSPQSAQSVFTEEDAKLLQANLTVLSLLYVFELFYRLRLHALSM